MFEVKNELGRVVANHDMLTVGLRSKGSVTCNLRAVNSTLAQLAGASTIRNQVNSAWYATSSVPSSPEDFVAIRPTNGKPVGIGWSPDGGVAFVGYSTDNTAPTLDYWVFGRRPTPRTTGFGIEVKRADGTVAFNNLDNPMEVRAVAVESAGGSVYATTSGQYAICPGIPIVRPSQYVYDSSDGQFYVVEQAFMFTLDGNGFAGQVLNSQIQRSGDSSQFAAPYANKCTTFLVDIGKLANAVIE